jgi:hypothetical protein
MMQSAEVEPKTADDVRSILRRTPGTLNQALHLLRQNPSHIDGATNGQLRGLLDDVLIDLYQAGVEMGGHKEPNPQDGRAKARPKSL